MVSKLSDNFKFWNHDEILWLVLETKSRWGSHSKFVDVWMHKLRGFGSSKLWVTSPITVHFDPGQFWTDWVRAEGVRAKRAL